MGCRLFLLVDHQGLELDQPLKNAINRRFLRTAFYVFSKVFSWKNVIDDSRQ